MLFTIQNNGGVNDKKASFHSTTFINGDAVMPILVWSCSDLQRAATVACTLGALAHKMSFKPYRFKKIVPVTPNVHLYYSIPVQRSLS